MTRYRIVCTEQEPANNPRHSHIVAVGVGITTENATQRLTKSQVIEGINKGDAFYTQGNSSGRIAEVEKYYCTPCKSEHIRSKQDSVSDNNLDNLRVCRGWHD